MIAAANDIDRILGLARFDSAIADAAGIIAMNYAEAKFAPVAGAVPTTKPAKVGQSIPGKISDLDSRPPQLPEDEVAKASVPACKEANAPTVAPLLPPSGYTSWLAYALATMDTRSLDLEHCCGHQGQWPETVSRDDLREAAWAELAQLRSAQWDVCPGIERRDGVWFFTRTKAPVVSLFAALGRMPRMLEEWRGAMCPEVTKDQLRAVFACVLRSLESKSP